MLMSLKGKKNFLKSEPRNCFVSAVTFVQMAFVTVAIAKSFWSKLVLMVSVNVL
jgi:hypothetical protein